VYALSVWGYAPSQVWLTRCCRAYRSWWGSPSSFPAALVRYTYSLATLAPCQPLPRGLQLPGAAVGSRKQAPAVDTSGRSNGRGAAGADSLPGSVAVAAAAADPADQVDKVVGSSATSGTGPQLAAAAAAVPPWENYSHVPGSEGPAPSAPLPSFNWLCAFLVEARRLIDRLKPSELGTLLWALARLRHTPDLVFMEAWYTAAAAKMEGTRMGVLALQLQALGLLQPGQGVPGAVPERFLLLAVGRAEQLLQEGEGSAADLGQVLWGLAQLRYWPGQRWMQLWYEGEVQIMALGGGSLQLRSATVCLQVPQDLQTPHTPGKDVICALLTLLAAPCRLRCAVTAGGGGRGLAAQHSGRCHVGAWQVRLPTTTRVFQGPGSSTGCP
jgi:hypothetical protein